MIRDKTLIILEHSTGASVDPYIDQFRGGLKDGIEVIHMNQLISECFEQDDFLSKAAVAQFQESGTIKTDIQHRLLLKCLDEIDAQAQPAAANTKKPKPKRSSSRTKTQAPTSTVTVPAAPTVAALAQDMPPDAPLFVVLQGFPVTVEWVTALDRHRLRLGGSITVLEKEPTDVKPPAGSRPGTKKGKKPAKKESKDPIAPSPGLPETTRLLPTGVRTACIEADARFMAIDVHVDPTAPPVDVAGTIADALRDDALTRLLYTTWCAAATIQHVGAEADGYIGYRTPPPPRPAMDTYNGLLDALPDAAVTPVTVMEALLRQVDAGHDQEGANQALLDGEMADSVDVAPGTESVSYATAFPSPEVTAPLADAAPAARRFVLEAYTSVAATCIPIGLDEPTRAAAVQEALPRAADLLDPRHVGPVSKTSGSFDRAIALRELVSFLTDKERQAVLPAADDPRPGADGFDHVTVKPTPAADVEDGSKDSGLGDSTVMDIESPSLGPSMAMSTEGGTSEADESEAPGQAMRMINIQHVILLLALHDSLADEHRGVFVDTDASFAALRHLVSEYVFGTSFSDVHSLYWNMFMSQQVTLDRGGSISAVFDPLGLRLIVRHDPDVPAGGLRVMGYDRDATPEKAFDTVPSVTVWARVRSHELKATIAGLLETDPSAKKKRSLTETYDADRVRIAVTKGLGTPNTRYTKRGDPPPAVFYHMGPVDYMKAEDTPLPPPPTDIEPEDDDESEPDDEAPFPPCPDDPAQLIPDDISYMYPSCNGTVVTVNNRKDGQTATLRTMSDGMDIAVAHDARRPTSLVATFGPSDGALGLGGHTAVYTAAGLTVEVDHRDGSVQLTTPDETVLVQPDGSQHTIGQEPSNNPTSLYEDGSVTRYDAGAIEVTMPDGRHYSIPGTRPESAREMCIASAAALEADDEDQTALSPVTVARTRDRLTDTLAVSRRDMVSTVTTAAGISVTNHADQTRLTIRALDHEAPGADVPGFAADAGYASITVEHPTRGATVEYCVDGAQAVRRVDVLLKNGDRLVVKRDAPLRRSGTQPYSYTLLKADGAVIVSTVHNGAVVVKAAPRGTTHAHKVMIDQYNKVSDAQDDLEPRSRLFNQTVTTTPPRPVMSEAILAKVLLGEAGTGETDPYIEPILKSGVHHVKLTAASGVGLVYHLTDYLRNVAIVTMDDGALNADFLGPHLDRGQEVLQDGQGTPELLKQARDEAGSPTMEPGNLLQQQEHPDATPAPPTGRTAPTAGEVSGITDMQPSTAHGEDGAPESTAVHDDEGVEESGYDMESGYTTESDFGVEDAPARRAPVIPGINHPIGGDPFPSTPYTPPEVPATQYIEAAPHPGTLWSRPRLFVLPLTDVDQYIPEPSEASSEYLSDDEEEEVTEQEQEEEYAPTDVDEAAYPAPDVPTGPVHAGSLLTSYVDMLWPLYAIAQARVDVSGLRVVAAPLTADQAPVPCRLGLLMPQPLNQTVATITKVDPTPEYTPYSPDITEAIPVSMRLGPVISKGVPVRRGTTRGGTRGGARGERPATVHRGGVTQVYATFDQLLPVFDDHLSTLRQAASGYAQWKADRADQEQLMVVEDPRAAETVEAEAVLRQLLTQHVTRDPDPRPIPEYTPQETQGEALFPEDEAVMPDHSPDRDMGHIDEPRMVESVVPTSMEPAGQTDSYFATTEGKHWSELGDEGFNRVLDHYDLEASRLGLPAVQPRAARSVAEDIERQVARVALVRSDTMPTETVAEAVEVEPARPPPSFLSQIAAHEEEVALAATQTLQSVAEPNVSKIIMEGTSMRLPKTTAVRNIAKRCPNRLYMTVEPTPTRVDFGAIVAGRSYQTTLRLTNIGVQSLRLKLTEPGDLPGPVPGKVWVDWTPGPVAAGLATAIRVGITTVAGTAEHTGPHPIAVALTIRTASEILAVPVVAELHPAGADLPLARAVREITSNGKTWKLQSSIQRQLEREAGPDDVGPTMPSTRRDWREMAEDVDLEAAEEHAEMRLNSGR